MGFSICAGTGRDTVIWIVQAKANSEKMAELTISYYLYEIRYDDISDMEVYQKKSLNLLKKKIKTWIYITTVNNQPKGLLDFEVLADNNINMPSWSARYVHSIHPECEDKTLQFFPSHVMLSCAFLWTIIKCNKYV